MRVRAHKLLFAFVICLCSGRFVHHLVRHSPWSCGRKNGRAFVFCSVCNANSILVENVLF